MARTKKHKPGWSHRQDKKQAKNSVKSTAVPSDQPDPTKIPANTNTMATTSHADASDDSTRPSKRVKTTDSDADRIPQFAEQAPADSKSQKMQTKSTPSLVDQVLPEQLRPLKATCNFVTMSIISSSRIQQKVRSLLDHMAKFSFADIKGKPGVVMLRARGDVAAKMISIVEIAKREIEKERGKWWQYSGVHAEVTELKEPQMTEDSYTEEALLDWQKQQKYHVDGAKTEAQQATNDPKTANEPDPTDEEDDFESMDQEARDEETTATGESEPRKKIRSVPVMMTYMSRVPIPELKETYGYTS
ncbi:MAG: hypothetical protein LQ347_002025 [Umbilicaria vellea]|nr:MAG: hypothetical protein LQ347_002025 [Umbilicaria vellea]